MPGWLTTVLLALLLSLLSYKLAVRGIITFKQESKDIAATHAAQEQAREPVTWLSVCASQWHSNGSQPDRHL